MRQRKKERKKERKERKEEKAANKTKTLIDDDDDDDVNLKRYKQGKRLWNANRANEEKESKRECKLIILSLLYHRTNTTTTSTYRNICKCTMCDDP